MAKAEEKLKQAQGDDEIDPFAPPEPTGMKILIRRLDTPEGRQKAIDSLREMRESTPEEAAEDEKALEILMVLLDEDRLSSGRPLFRKS
jgi:hypothetical protein